MRFVGIVSWLLAQTSAVWAQPEDPFISGIIATNGKAVIHAHVPPGFKQVSLIGRSELGSQEPDVLAAVAVQGGEVDARFTVPLSQSPRFFHVQAHKEPEVTTSDDSEKADFVIFAKGDFQGDWDALAPGDIWISAREINLLPTSGPAWEALKAEADRSIGYPDLSDREDRNNVGVLAKALVYARTGQERYREEVIAACQAAIGTESWGRTLALAREIGAYVIAADIVGYRDETFAKWLHQARNRNLGGRNEIHSLRNSAFHDPSNWGCHARFSYAAICRYLGDDKELDKLAQRMRDYLGAGGNAFKFEELWWQADPKRPVGINPRGAVIDGHNVDGVIPDDQRRSGEFIWPPPKENYVWESLQGTVACAEILHRAGYNVWNWQHQAIRRAVRWLHEQANYPAEEDDTWVPHLINKRYGTSYPAPIPAEPGKNMGWTDWTHQ